MGACVSRNAASDSGMAPREPPAPGKLMVDATTQPKAGADSLITENEGKMLSGGAAEEARSPESNVIRKKGTAVLGHSPSYKAQAVPKRSSPGALPAETPQATRKGPGLSNSQEASGAKTPSPSPVSQAPPGVVPANPELQYAAPYIPLPNGPEPEYPEELLDVWRPTRSRAVLVGCNYVDHPDIMLRGSVNDVNCLKHMLITRFGYTPENIILLQDQQPFPEYLPTKANVLAAIRWLVGAGQSTDIKACESLFFAFAGHGLRQSPEGLDSARSASKENAPPTKGSGNDRVGTVVRGGVEFGDWEETLLPSDYDVAGSLTGSELYEALVAPLQKNQRLHCCIDACQSGFSLDLPHRGYIRADAWAGWEKGQPRGPAPLRDPRINRQPRRIGAVFRGTAGGEAIMLGTSPDDDFDSFLSQADASNFRMHASTGAIAFAMIQAVEQGQASTYTKLLRAMKYAGKNGPTHLNKMPELSSSHVFNLSRPFVL